MSRILLGVSGGIAAYKALELIRLATAAGHSVRVVQTPTSQRFVGAASFAALSGAPVLVSEFERDPARGAFPDQEPPTHEPPSHLELVSNADVFLIAPASANTIAKLAAGIADGLLTSCALAARCPVLVAPAMNNHMYEHQATAANLRTLAARGVAIVEPGVGRLASLGEQGIGRLAEPERLLAACESALLDTIAAGPDGEEANPREGLRGLRVLVSAGGTREPIDSVRFIGNSSSGRMGMALADAAAQRGAHVTVVAANVAIGTPPGVQRRDVRSAAELARACAEEFPRCDVLLMAAAVADFTPAAPEQGKIRKGGRERLEIVLEATEDVLSSLSSVRREGQTLVGFAAEHGPAAVEGARAKLRGKDLDAIVVNDISRPDIGFDVEANEVTVLSVAGKGAAIEEHHLPRAAKAHIAHAILDRVEALRGSR
jgi:phosphopantothenoylcysteine decarboxylase/phosphopantothenate--cysteine ligase